jgi:hypothetical protein
LRVVEKNVAKAPPISLQSHSWVFVEEETPWIALATSAPIRSALHLLNLQESCISTFDSWCLDYYKLRVSHSVPRKLGSKKFDWQAIRKEVWKAVRTFSDSQRPFECVLVDEGQDLEPVCFDILKAVSRHVTVCMDHKQQIYRDGSGEAEIVKRLGLKNSNSTLLSAFRCSPYIVELAAQFVGDVDQRLAFIRQNRVPATETETPLLYVADNPEDERARLAEVVRARQSMGEKMAVLLPDNYWVMEYARSLTNAGLQIEIREEGWRNDPRFPPLAFTSELPKSITYHSGKGLTFDSVFLPGVPRGFR